MSTYVITFKRGQPKTITLNDIVSVDYFAGHLYYSDGNLTYTYHVDEIESSEMVNTLRSIPNVGLGKTIIVPKGQA